MEDVKPPAKPDQEPDEEPKADTQPAVPADQAPQKPAMQDVKPPASPDPSEEKAPTEPKAVPDYAAGGDNEENPPLPDQETKPDEKEAKAEDNQPQVPKKPSNFTAKLPIIVALLVAIVLAGLTALAYVNSNKTDTTDESGTSTMIEEESTPAQETDVEEANQAVDEAVEAAGEAEEFSDSDLSDESLGL